MDAVVHFFFRICDDGKQREGAHNPELSPLLFAGRIGEGYSASTDFVDD